MPFTKKRAKSPSTTPVPSTEGPGTTQLPEKELDAMNRVLTAIYDYRTNEDFDPSLLFHRKPNKRILPEYYDTIKEPIALSTIKQKIMRRNYQSFSEFVRDFALIPFNAQVFNRPDSGAFQDALIVKEQLEKNLQQLVDDGIITKDIATLPDLGEIPTYEDVPAEENEEEEEESEEEGEEEDEEEDEEDAGATVQKRKRGRPSLPKRETGGDDEGSKKARGRPPKLLTPMEARIQAVLKGIRKPKNNRGQHLIRHFERAPDKAVTPEYYLEIKNPMAYDLLKRKVKRKKYSSLEVFMADVNLMFNNAKHYNTDDSQIYQDAVTLQVEAGRLYDIEKAKSDSAFVDDEGKIPMPEGALRNGELYKVGDWVHVQNPNDLTKPIPAQIYRTYRNQSGQVMVNVCWYYRPEQTVHRFDKHFFDHEVVKTGRYRDHHIEEIEGRCFVMFTTRFFKGRPRGLPEGTEIYVCEARYNEEKHQFNKIKTWASCLPDEVRDRDYEMDLYDHPKRMKKFPSPIKYLLKDEQLETDDFPKPTWGAEGAPPKIGAIHRRPRTDRDSLPPEPTPPPPPKMPTPPPRQIAQPNLPSSLAQTQAAQQRPNQTIFRQSYGGVGSGSYSQTPSSMRPTTSTGPLTPQVARPLAQTATSGYGHTAASVQSSTGQLARPTMPTSASSYRDPPPIEVYSLPDQANLSIPADIRAQYRQDDLGRILFFTAPPVIPAAPLKTSVARHSVRYLAEKARRAEVLTQKRKERDEAKIEADHKAKRVRVEAVIEQSKVVADMKGRALSQFWEELQKATLASTSDSDIKHVLAQQESVKTLRRNRALHSARRDATRHIPLTSSYFADDLNTRVG